jgi:2-C-methyl-D-erythritol 4-phosphate cytidylyltransferase
MIVEAYERSTAGEVPAFTDEASLVEAAGFPVEVVPGGDRNIKVTTEDDFTLAELLADQ